MNLCELSEQFWKWYMNGTDEADQSLLLLLAPNCSVFGPGGHEQYDSILPFAQALQILRSENQSMGIRFSYRDFWCKEAVMDENFRITYGGLQLIYDYPSDDVHIEMPSRFTFCFQHTADSWKLLHIHHSIANQDQLGGEFYPKTLSAQMAQIQKKVLELKELAERDGLTGLLNFRTLQEIYNLRLHHSTTWLIVLDLDDFKRVNDTYGHMAGNTVLCRLSKILQDCVRQGDVVARIGGDEFSILLDTSSEDVVRSVLERILGRVQEAADTEPFHFGISMGAVRAHPNEPLRDALDRADTELYRVKQHGKGAYRLG